jgi:hypothetical protein
LGVGFRHILCNNLLRCVPSEFPVFSFILLAGACAVAQQPAATTATASVPAQPPAPAYDTAVLPKSKKAAWEMLGAANGLQGDAMTLWDLEAQYKVFAADGKTDTPGKLSVVWSAPDR